MTNLIRTLLLGRRARGIAEGYCRLQYPAEPVNGSWIAASEPARFVVRVFCGRRTSWEDHEPSFTRLPPWKICRIIAVDKATGEPEPVKEDMAYRPTIR